MRRKLATLFVVLYAFCVLAPHAAMALVYGPDLAHCLTESGHAPHQHTAKTMHVHDDGAVHEHGQAKAQEPSKADEPQAACCGLFFMSALAAESDPLLIEISSGKAIASGAPKDLTDHPPGRINEPPIA
jgi:hypothetical protein